MGHCPAQLDKVIRWIANTGDQAAMGLALPATAEPEGYHAEKGKGNIKVLAGGESVRLNLRAGALTTAEAAATESKIEALLS